MEKEKFILRNKKKFFLNIVILFTILITTLNIAFSYCIKLLIDSGINLNVRDLKRALIITTVVIIAYAVGNKLVLMLQNKFIYKEMLAYKNNIFKSILNKDIKNFKKYDVAEYISLISISTKKIEEGYLREYFSIIKKVSMMSLSLLAMIIMNWKLTVYIIIACLIPIGISSSLGQVAMKIEKKFLKTENRYISKVKDLLSGFSVIKTFNAEDTTKNQFDEINNELIGVQKRQTGLETTIQTISELSGMLVFLVAFGGGMFMVVKGQASIGEITAIVQLVNFVVMPLNELGIGIGKYKTSIETLKLIESRIKNEDLEEIAGDKKLSFNDKITFEEVSFAYDEANNKKILNNLNFTIEKGKKYAVVGESGSGKSTIFRLLLKFINLRNHGGTIKIDNRNIDNISLNNIYEIISIIEQDVYIFDNTLKHNITLGMSFGDDEINKAIEVAGLFDLVKNSKDGINMKYGELGGLLSGGQKQRVAIARAVLRNKEILLMDEATSSLDKATTYSIEDTILKSEKLTTLVITHKLEESILKKYDKILFMKNGKVSECGDFESMIKRKGDFYRLFKNNYANEDVCI